MGLLELFKKKPIENKSSKKCSECFRPINGYVWSLDNKKFCKECYNRKMAIIQQAAGQSPEEYDFEMTIEDVFLIKNHGVVVTGKIHRGVIHRNDVVTINGATYTVTLIDVIPNQVEYAKEGANVGLHLSTMNSSAFKRGDMVTAKRFETAPTKNTFICDVCKKELPIKYRHNGNTCVECAEEKSVPAAPKLSWVESIQALNEDKISLQEFINMNAQHPLFYSTPAGENSEEQVTLWLLNHTKLNMRFYPTFLSKEYCYKSLSSAGRKNFIIIEGTLESALSSLDTSPVLADAGLLIQDENGQLAIPPKMRVQK